MIAVSSSIIAQNVKKFIAHHVTGKDQAGIAAPIVTTVEEWPVTATSNTGNINYNSLLSSRLIEAPSVEKVNIDNGVYKEYKSVESLGSSGKSNALISDVVSDKAKVISVA